MGVWLCNLLTVSVCGFGNISNPLLPTASFPPTILWVLSGVMLSPGFFIAVAGHPLTENKWESAVYCLCILGCVCLFGVVAAAASVAIYLWGCLLKPSFVTRNTFLMGSFSFGLWYGCCLSTVSAFRCIFVSLSGYKVANHPRTGLSVCGGFCFFSGLHSCFHLGK